MRTFRLLSICVWLLGCGAGGGKPGLGAPDDNHDSGAATQADAGEQHDAQTPDAATREAHDAGLDQAPPDAGSDQRGPNVSSHALLLRTMGCLLRSIA